MKKTLLALGAVAILGGTLPVIPSEQEFLFAYTGPTFDTPDTTLHVGEYFQLEDGSGYYGRVNDTDLPRNQYAILSEKQMAVMNEVHITGYQSKAVFKDSQGKKSEDVIPASKYEEMKSDASKNPTKTESETVLGALITPKRAGAAIAFDAATDGGGAVGTSLTFSHTTTGSNRGLMIFAFDAVAGDRITGATYAAVGATLVNNQSCGIGCGHQKMLYLNAPATGANNVVISASPSVFIGGAASSYTGVSQTGQPEANDLNTDSGVTSLSTSVTTLTTNAWTVMVNTNSSGAPTAGSGTTLRTSNANGWGTLDSNGGLAIGSNALVANFSSATGVGNIIMALAPVADPQTNAFFNEF